MPGKTGRRKLRVWIALVLLFVVVAFFVQRSVQEKNGGLDADSFKLPGIETITALFDDYAAGYPSAPVDREIENPGVTVHFIDVGQAKSILIEAPQKNVLIDAGEAEEGAKVVRYLAAQNVRTIDILIGTHPHSDHIGGIDTVLAGMPADAIILPQIPEAYTPTTATYARMLKEIKKAGIKITPAKSGAEYDLGGGAVLTLLGPVADYEDLNAMSVVSRLNYGEVAFLFTGDSTKEAERDMMEKDARFSANVLDVAHHGSNTSTSEQFLAAVNPSVSVLSCGIDNMYGHPHREVVAALRQRGEKIYRTDLDGTVIVSTDGESIGVQTEKGGED